MKVRRTSPCGFGAGRRGVFRRASTLVELLIVAGIIAILAAIAVPNLIEAQTRSKVARVYADLRAIAAALESYAMDHTCYPPNDGVYNVAPVQLTNPIAYLTDSKLVDPFSGQLRHPVHGELARFYTYTSIVTRDEFEKILQTRGAPSPPIEAVDHPAFNPGALARYGRWRLVSNGPDMSYSDPDFVFGADPSDPNGVLMGSDVPYDPTNGTRSKGNILRTQRETVRR